ncbi:MAG: hypothetical protein M3Q10_12265, partial [Chloroflexota bacterium]|nr:hypothetical protein [Chloroflexota bacterium]
MVALALIAGAANVSANANPDDEKKPKPVPVEEAAKPVEEGGDEGAAVSISGGDVTTTTSVGISADGGTAISDASGGDDNFAFDNVDGGGQGDQDGGQGDQDGGQGDQDGGQGDQD